MKHIAYVDPNKNCEIKLTLENGKEVILSEYEVNKIATLLERFDARKKIEDEIKTRVENGKLDESSLIIKDKGSITPLINFYLMEKEYEMNKWFDEYDVICEAFNDFDNDITNQKELDDFIVENFEEERIEELKMLEAEEEKEDFGEER